MKVFKFGGASVKDADAVKNLGKILNRFSGEHIVVVISAMGKMTNALEALVRTAYQQQDYDGLLMEFKTYHEDIIQGLSLDLNIDYFIDHLIEKAEGNRAMHLPQYYDQIVSVGELLSTTIITAYLNSVHISCTWLDARDVIETDETWREGAVDWVKTEKKALDRIPEILTKGHVVTQGFIGKAPNGLTTTLGREGSDYTGAILAKILKAEGLFIWKDVPGVLNADPKLFPKTINIREISYYEAIEMTYYGASVIHPKTIKPLQNGLIPLLVKSFVDPALEGTRIHYTGSEILYPPVIIVKKDQILISIYTTDFSFIAEKNLSHIYEILALYNVKVNMMQTAAISCTICIDANDYKIRKLEEALGKYYSIQCNDKLELLTIRHYTTAIITELTAGKEIILTQKSRNTLQILY